MTAIETLRTLKCATAKEVSQAANIPLEAVYAELVSAEAAGTATLRINFCGKKVLSREWVAE